MRIVKIRSIPEDFEIVAYLSERGYRFEKDFVFYDFINGWQIWMWHPSGISTNLGDYAIGIKDKQLVVVDPENAVFQLKWLHDLYE